VGIVATETARSVPDRMVAVEVAADEDAEAGTGAAAGLLGHLQGEAIGRDDIVAADDPFVLDTEDVVEVDAAHGDEGGGGIGGGRPNSAVKAGRKRSRR
jgi:hypothetical protein